MQGVWFRDSTRRQALQLGLSGYAKNLANGDVEVLVSGEVPALEALGRWLHTGPPLATVTSVEEGEGRAENLPPGAGFEIA